MNPIHFLPNVPQLLSLKDTSGVIDGFNVLYETSDNRVLQLPRPAAVKLNLLDPAEGEEISVTKHQEPKQPAEWVFALTPKSEQARAAKESQSELERQLAESLEHIKQHTAPAYVRCQRCFGVGRIESMKDSPSCPDCGGKGWKAPIATVRQMPKSARTGTPEPAEAPRGTGTYGPVPQVALASRKTPQRIPYNIAVREIIQFVTAGLRDAGEQWADGSKQDMVSTIIIAAAKQGLLEVWER
jgi:hypothetical protein